MSYSSNYTITTLSASVEQYSVFTVGARAPIIPSGRVRQTVGGAPYTAVNGTSKKFPLGFVCYNGDWVPGKVGNYALKFDGTNDWVSVGAAADWGWMNGKGDTTGFKWTVSFWMKFNQLPSSINTYATVISTNDFGGNAGITIYYDDTGGANCMGLLVKNSAGGNVIALTGPTTYYPDDLQWHHVVVTFNMNADNGAGVYDANIYIDGNSTPKAQTNTTGEPSDANSTRELQIGSAGQGTAYPTPAALDELAIWNVVLTATEIGQLYANGLGQPASNVQSSNLVSYFNFEGGSGNSTIGNYSSAISGSLGGGMQNMDAGTACEFPVKTTW